MVQTAPKITPPTQVALALRQIIQSVYRDGVDAVLTFELDDSGDISGVFRDGRQLYNYTITDDGEISYVERDAKRGDSYLEGYYLTGCIPLNGASTAYTKGAVDSRLRLDRGKQKQCSTGKSCGNTCIAKGVRCNQELGVKQQQALKGIKSVLPQRKFPNSAALASAALAATALGVAGAGIMLQRSGGRDRDEEDDYLPAPKTPKQTNKKQELSDKQFSERLKEIESIANTPPNGMTVEQTLKMLEDDIVTEQEVEAASKEIEAEEKAVAAQKERESAQNEREINKQVAKQLGYDPEVEEELRKMQSAQEEDRVKQLAGQIKTTLTGRSRTEAPIQINERSKDIDIKRTLTSLGIGNPSAAIVDMDSVGQAIKSHTARRLHQEHQKGIDDIATDAFRAMELTKLMPSAQARSTARQRIRIQTAQRLQQFNKEFFGVAKKTLSDTKANFQEFGREANEAQMKGRAMSADKIELYQQAFSTNTFTRNLTDASVRVRNQISLNPKRVTRSGMTDKKAKQIIKGVNKLTQERSQSPFKRQIKEDSQGYVDLVKKLIAIAAW